MSDKTKSMSKKPIAVSLPPPRNIHLLEKDSFERLGSWPKPSSYRPVPVRVAHERWAGDFHAISEGYRVSGLFFVEEGYGWFAVDEHTFTIRGPQIMLYPQGRPRRFWCRQTNPWRVWILEMAMPNSILGALCGQDAGTWKAPTLLPLFQRAHKMAALGDWTAVTDYAVILLRELTYAPAVSEVSQTAAQRLVSEFESLLATADLCELTSPRVAAERLGVTTRKLGDACRIVIKRTPSARLTELRMRMAETQLSTGLNVKTVAAEFGYADAFAFSKVFRRTMGFAPSLVHAQYEGAQQNA